jgi:hypothetical protein
MKKIVHQLIPPPVPALLKGERLPGWLPDPKLEPVTLPGVEFCR